MSSAVAAIGTLLKIGDGGGSEVFTTIFEVMDISGPGLARDTLEVTNHSSPGSWEEFIAGVKRSGEVTFDVNYLPTTATHNATTGLIADMNNGTKRNFQLVFPNAGNTTWAFTALVNGFEPAAPVADVLRASVTLKLTGQPTLA